MAVALVADGGLGLREDAEVGVHGLEVGGFGIGDVIGSLNVKAICRVDLGLPFVRYLAVVLLRKVHGIIVEPFE